MRTDTPKTIYLKDYTPYPFKVETLDLNFDIHDGYSVVTAKSRFIRTDDSVSEVFLNGEELELLSLKIDGKEINDYTKDDTFLKFDCNKGSFDLEIQTKIYPEKNTRLEGLYNSGGTYCTQCEAEGFRRITYYPDRPDVLTVFNVRIEADKKYPVLLSNGNRTDGGEVGEDRHFTIWEDPYPKPCYLFALVAGDLNHIHDGYISASGRDVDLYIYVREGDEDQCAHAMDSLKRSMKWDEEVYGLEYDLDTFNIVAVSDFNMGAMENKSLNIFNTALVLAHQETATDSDFMRVESVIAHEYFHNWSGNRVTCRDWFQLSLKEGLTVFRDQEFSADTHSRDVQRIDDVSHLRRFQFAEDASPLAHPIRPDNYIEINNFYTMTVYEKGAEIIRMLRTILGDDNYRKGTDLYFERHDGQAVTCDDFVQAMEDTSGVDLSQFRLWYSQAGTPEIEFKGHYENGVYRVNLKQNIPDTAGQTDKKPMTIPFAFGLLDEDGQDLIEPETLLLENAEQEFVITGVAKTPKAPSLLRGFSAPVKLYSELINDDLAFLMVNDSDGFNRWEASQNYYLNTINQMIDSGDDVSESFLETYGGVIESALSPKADNALMARTLTLPDISRIGQTQDVIDTDQISKARKKILASIKRTHKPILQKLYKQNRTADEFSISPKAVGQRNLQNVVLSLLTATSGTGCASLAKMQYDNANNMTDRVAALSRLTDNENEERVEAFEDFYNRFKNYPLVIDKWFSLQAISQRKNAIEDIIKLRSHSDFNIKNPNRVRSLYSAFAMNNTVHFHAVDGSGYEFLKDAIIELNSINPQIAARLLTPFREWQRYTVDRQNLMKQALSEILEIKDIAPDIYEIASKSLS